jgi:zinc protease
VIALLLAVAAALPAPLPPVASVAQPVAVETQLPNGLRVLVTENHALPLVAVELLIGAGPNADPAGRAGLADFTAELSLECSAAERADAASATFKVAAQLETTVLAAEGLRDAVRPILEALAQASLTSSFDDRGLQSLRARRLAKKQTEEANWQRLRHAAWGSDSPWSQTVDAHLEELTPADVQAFHARWYQPQNAILSIAGDVTADEAVELVRAQFGGWARGESPPAVPARLAALQAGAVTLVDWPKSTFGELQVRGFAPDPAGPEILALTMANAILGGLDDSRLNRELRDKHAYSRNVRSQIYGSTGRGVFWISARITSAEHLAAAAAAVRRQLQLLSSVSASEVTTAKLELLRDSQRALQTNASVAHAMAVLAHRHQPLDYYRTLPGAVAAVDAAQVSRVARRWLAPEQVELFVAGPRATVEPALKVLHLEPVRVVSTD